MTYEVAVWVGRIIPLLCLVGICTFVYLAAKRRAPTSYPPGSGIRFFDRDGNEVTGRRRIVMTSLMVVVLIALLVAAVLPWL